MEVYINRSALHGAFTIYSIANATFENYIEHQKSIGIFLIFSVNAALHLTKRIH